jgi:hypothetical protein
MPLTRACSSRQRYKPLARLGIAVEDDVLAGGTQFGLDLVVDVELPGIDDRHVHPGRDRMVEEHRVHRFPHDFVAAEAERQVRKPARDMNVRAARLDLLARLDEVDAVIVMLLDARRHREHIRIEDDVLGREADPDEQLIRPLANLDFALFRIGLADLVERHDDYRGAVRHAFARMAEELFLAFLHADRVDDRLARNALEPGLDHVPLGRVDHHRNPRDVGLGLDQFEERGHRLVCVEQAFVHVDVEHLCAGLDLLQRDFDRRGIIPRHHQLLEAGGAGDVGALADIDEAGRGGGGVHILFLLLPFRLRQG